MSAILIFILRLLLAAILYTFIGWALYTIWKDLKLQTQLVHPKRTPPLKILAVSGIPEIEHLFTQSEILLGRDPASDFPLTHETVSAHHARISYHHNQWWVEDTRSTNGTYLNDQKVELPTVLTHNDELRCGQVVLAIIDPSR